MNKNKILKKILTGLICLSSPLALCSCWGNSDESITLMCNKQDKKVKIVEPNKLSNDKIKKLDQEKSATEKEVDTLLSESFNKDKKEIKIDMSFFVSPSEKGLKATKETNFTVKLSDINIDEFVKNFNSMANVTAEVKPENTASK